MFGVVVLAATMSVLAAPPALGDAGKSELLYVGSGSTITALSAETGAVRFTRPWAVATRDWSRVFSTETYPGGTILRTSDARSGATIATRRLRAVLGLRAVSDDGTTLAFTPNTATGANPYQATARSTTPITIVRGDDAPRTYTVNGNVEPEAFSLSKRTLFVIEYTPPTAPDRYRVARVSLTGRRTNITPRAVRSKEDELQEPMRGTARAQTIAPDGRQLYALYTRDATATEPAEAFVHVLDLERERATCVDLPPEFAADPVGAVAVSPSGTRLYVVSPAVGAVAELDVASLTVARTGRLPAASSATTVRATVTNETTLHVSTDSVVTAVDLRELSTRSAWSLPERITGIQPASRAGTLFVSLPDRVLAVDADSGSVSREYPVADAGPIDHVAPALRPIAGIDGSVQCAC
jgi:hypothetical protein